MHSLLAVMAAMAMSMPLFAEDPGDYANPLSVSVDGLHIESDGTEWLPIWYGGPYLWTKDGTLRGARSQVIRDTESIVSFDGGRVEYVIEIIENGITIEATWRNESRMLHDDPSVRLPYWYAEGISYTKEGPIKNRAEADNEPCYLIAHTDAGSLLFELLCDDRGSAIWCGPAGQHFASYARLPDVPAGESRSITIRVTFWESITEYSYPELRHSLNQFRKIYPSEFVWPDRRPIGAYFTANPHGTSEENLRGWMPYVYDPSKTEAFEDQYIANLENVCQRMVDVNYQGVIIWDLPGQEGKHPLSYLGNPAQVYNGLQGSDGRGVCPEMSPQLIRRIGETFAKHDLEWGVTLRPTELYATPRLGFRFDHQALDYPEWVEKMAGDVRTMRKFGARLFYVDSNTGSDTRTNSILERQPRGGALPPWQCRELTRQFPDCFFTFEHSPTIAWYSFNAPFAALNEPSRLARYLYPECFTFNSLQHVWGRDRPEDASRIESAIKSGSIVSPHAHFPDWNESVILKAMKAGAE